jgi:hypothetical protein
MKQLRYASRSLEAGLLAGVAVAAFYFLTDLARIRPLSTPDALAAAVLPHVESPDRFVAIANTAAVLAFGGRLAAFSVLHLAVFALLGLGFGLATRGLGIRPGPRAGILYGAIVCSLVFLAGTTLAGGPVLETVPGPVSVILANALAGLVMGGFLGRHGARLEVEPVRS